MEELSLYKISNGISELMNQEEINEEEKALIYKELTEMLVKKSEGVIGYSKNLELNIDAVKTEISRLKEYQETLENRMEKYKEYVKNCMELSGITKLETSLGTLSIAKNPISVEIVNEDEIPGEFKSEVITTKIDKTAIKNCFKETGELINGVRIISDKTSLRIK